ncbi:uncharacterized protein LOC126623944 [Malus sylvestris]|uniref:uncharacterized protein LOC126623944 n=1 Tax=Malus sylvestris TaxID=3752 RepID=UPI0021ABEA70|nr:uncharacterized protein LOC126623944 [Malus sylvestris]
MEYWKTLTVRSDLMKEGEDSSRPDQKERERLKKMEKLKDSYKYAMEQKCEELKEMFENHPEIMREEMTVDGDTVLHLAASYSSKSQGKKVLEMLINILCSINDKMKAVRVPNKYGNNTLHEVSVSGNKEAAEYLVSNFNKPVPEEVKISTSSTDKENYAPQLREARDLENYELLLREARDLENELQKQKARDSENYALQLLETRNYLGETPLFRAAALGHTDLVKLYADKLQADNLWRHFHRDDKMSVLHITVVAQHFETAIWLLEKYPSLALLEEDKGLTSLQLLAQMPTAFYPNFEESKWKMLIYYCLPDGGNVVTPHQKDDVESGMDGNHPRPSVFRKKLAVVMKAYYSLWDSLAKVNVYICLTMQWIGIGGPQKEVIYMIWKEKKNKKFLNKLIQLLVKLDDHSLLTPSKQAKIRTISLWEKPDKEKEATKSGTTNGDEGGEKGNAAADKHFSWVREITEFDRYEKEKEATKSRKEARSELYNSSPLLIATIKGIEPIVREILEQRPQAAEHVNRYERNILHLAIKNRRENILDLIESEPTLMSKLSMRIDRNGNTILHQAADRTYYSIAVAQKVIGPAMELQKELLWKQRIKEMLPPHYIMHHNDNDQTEEELFNAGHDELLKSAQDWVKETARSCSTVAVLVATVVFAAAYAIPGGNEQNGRPVFENNPLFWLFTSMDVVAIACSLSSVAFFLSVLSSPLEYPNFVKSIPHKVMIGFIFLFLSMATTMLAFAATILLLIRIEKKWTKSLFYPIAFFPVPLFGLLQFPVYQFVKTMFLKMDAWFFKPLLRSLGFRKKKLIWKTKAH